MTLAPLKEQLKCVGRNESFKESNRFKGSGRKRNAWSIANVAGFFGRTPPATLTPWRAELGSGVACDRSCSSRMEEMTLEREPSDELELSSSCSRCPFAKVEESIPKLCCPRAGLCASWRFDCERAVPEDLSSLLGEA